MQIHVSPDDGLPVYKQIFNQIKYLVASGVLAHGEELPPIRALAEQLLINPNTVARAYRELEHAGIVVKRGTVGTFVSDAPSPFARRERLRVLRQSGGPVAAGMPLVELSNVAALEIVADFLTTDAVSVKPGAKATILDWGGSEALAARVRQVESGGFTKVSALGLEEQRVPIVLDLVTERPAALGNDFHVNVAVVVWSGRDVLTIPSTALFRVGESWAVFVVRDGRAHVQRVTVGKSDDTRTVIERDLQDGDEIVIQPSDALRDGGRVASLPTPAH